MTKRWLIGFWRKEKPEQETSEKETAEAEMEGSEKEDPNTVVVTREVKGAEMGAHDAKKLSENSVEIRLFMDSEMVNIHVGKDEGSGHFKLHKSIICGKVPYFEKIFNGRFIEGATNSATLPEDDPDAFNTIVFSMQLLTDGYTYVYLEMKCYYKLGPAKPEAAYT